MDWWWAYLAIGAGVGLLAGLLGIGGGMVIVPMLVLVFTAKHFPAAHLMHLALGTALATTVFTSLASVRAHHRHDGVDWRVVRAMAPGIATGSLGAALVAGLIATRPLAAIFTVFLFYAAGRALVEAKPTASRRLPGGVALFAVGAGIGGVASLLAAGGAFLSIPFLVWCNVPLRRAIGTAAANGFPIALAGSIGYVAQGLRATGLPEGTLGYIYLPALLFIVATSMLTAPLGARLTHRIPVKRLRMAYVLLLCALGVHMLLTLW